MSQFFFCISWPNYWRFSFSISPSSEYSGLISFRMDLLNLVAFHVTLESLLQHHNSKASIIWHSAFFMVLLSHPYVTTEKPTALTRLTFVSKVMSLLFNMLSRLVISIFFLKDWFRVKSKKDTLKVSICSVRMEHRFQNVTSKALQVQTPFYLSSLLTSLPPASDNCFQFLLVISEPFSSLSTHQPPQP